MSDRGVHITVVPVGSPVDPDPVLDLRYVDGELRVFMEPPQCTLDRPGLGRLGRRLLMAADTLDDLENL